MRSPQAHISWFALFLTGSVREWVTWIKWGEKQTRTMQTWEGQAGGQDGCFFSAGGTLVSFLQQGARRTCRVLSSCFLSCQPPLSSSLFLLRRAEPGLGVLCVCVSVGSDHHSKLYTVYQHLGEVVLWLLYGSLLLFIVLSIVFPNKSHTSDFFFVLFYFWNYLTQSWGDETDSNKTNTKSRFEIFFSTEMWCYWLSMTPKFDPLLHALIEFNLICLFVVFKLGSSNYLNPKLMSSNGVRDTFLAVACFLIPRPFYSKGSSRFVTFCKTKSSQSVKMIFLRKIKQLIKMWRIFWISV